MRFPLCPGELWGLGMLKSKQFCQGCPPTVSTPAPVEGHGSPSSITSSVCSSVPELHSSRREELHTASRSCCPFSRDLEVLGSPWPPCLPAANSISGPNWYSSVKTKESSLRTMSPAHPMLGCMAVTSGVSRLWGKRGATAATKPLLYSPGLSRVWGHLSLQQEGRQLRDQRLKG